ncbi:putative F-box domain-containing protein [Medicago truncatula]|uniref:F-box and associated interaction domain protein n=1 Tax=Medicago truncatula TaxID=3880 RepID=G8A1M6_MEDTR|nr:F-box and associated interaction domain protein [Medicago truncatula]RHN65497.1 putative F-box domain-containing protein [Medicago truncatula]
MVRRYTTYKERIRPTASARRRGYKHATSSEQQVVEEPCQELEDPRLYVIQDIGADDVDVNGFPDGPIDTLVLKTYTDHVAGGLWDEVSRGEERDDINKQLSIVELAFSPLKGIVRPYTKVRVRPTASARRRGYKHATSSKQQVVDESCQEIEDPHQNIVQDIRDDADVNGFSGCLNDTSILKTYTDQVTDRPWDEVSQGEEIDAINKQLSILTITSSPPTLSSNHSFHVLPLPTLPFDLIQEILCWLPVKLLLQLRCVCKSWNSLITDTSFTKKHLSMSTTRHIHFVRYYDPSNKYILTSYPLHSNFSTMFTNVTRMEYHPNNYTPNSSCYIVGSCHGILCLAHFYDEGFILLWNPSIRKFKELPSFQKPNAISDTRMTFGFGYDPIMDNYKVVVVLGFSVWFNNGDVVDKTEVKVHTLGTKFWITIQEFPFGCIPYELSGKFLGGTINWLASKVGLRESPCFIVSLDLGNVSYQEVLLPEFGEVDFNYLTLGVLRDCLGLISDHDVWIMKEYGNKESWIKLFTVSYMEDPFYMWGPSKSYALTKVVYIFEDEQVLLESNGSWSKKLVVYDPKDDMFKLQYNCAYNLSDGAPEVYVESLLSPWS